MKARLEASLVTYAINNINSCAGSYIIPFKADKFEIIGLISHWQLQATPDLTIHHIECQIFNLL